ncbi:hypothetical protein JVT61DRAFT_1584 [Boletus reticuloceps]|uniref:LysM domain-containing protein n=1 Tax=Boletus reticuloceps TaxID=495285 RepID=A0A8I2YRM2_9AGAM|nr:hypothetical protein JVT61DRAFT_1584 [Boletus reticuloceps]
MSNGPPLSRFTPNHDEPSPPEQIPDLEWEIRTGRAIYILERTLPDFFQLGLVSHIDPTRPDIVDVAVSESGSVESIYSPVVRLTYTPPVALPPPFPRTLSLEGLALYMASSVFIRHTMKTLYSDLRVEMRKLAVHTPSITAPPTDVTSSRRREKSLFVGLTVHGTTRVSGGTGEWQIDSTYGFSPVTHIVPSLFDPEIHSFASPTMFASALAVFLAVPFLVQCTLFLVSAQGSNCTRTYIVQPGDICDKISAQNNVSTYQLAVVNDNIIDLECDNLNPGSTICLGWAGEDCSTTYVVQPDDTCDDISYAYNINETIFYDNNPQLNADCTNLYIGEVVCMAPTVMVPALPASGTIPGSQIPATATPAIPYC